ncbi:MAG TPA: DNA polymerase IV [Gemmatimonadales bacterium]|nr:DNA polymerase IV [Gemmatimonadales bacterium]
MSERRILLADADAFYVSVARLVDPQGAGRSPLLIVGGSPERRGVVTSASYEARAFGVTSAMPMARAVRLCPGAMVVPVPWEACVEKGEAIRTALERFTPAVERASSDEFYLDLSGTERLYREEPLATTAARIRAAVSQATNLSMSVGGGTSKLVAKLAAGRAKPRAGSAGAGVHVVPAGDEERFLREFALADLPGVGPRFQEELARFGLRLVTEALRHDEKTLASWLGERAGRWLHERIRGIDRSDVDTAPEPKSISRDETFPKDLDDAPSLDRELSALADRAAADLRAAGLRARTVTVRIRDADFTQRQASRTLPAPVLSNRAILATARELLAGLRKARPVPARLLSVGLTQFVREEAPDQLALFDAPVSGVETERDRTLSRIVDRLRDRFGPDAAGWGR